MLNNSLFLNRSRDEASKLSKAFCIYEVTSLELSGDRSIVNVNYLPISTTDIVISFLSTVPAFQVYSANNTPCNHWWNLPLSAEFFFYMLFKYLWNPSFLIYLWMTLATACTRISTVSWKVFLEIPEKVHMHPQQSFLGAQMEQVIFPKAYRAA